MARIFGVFAVVVGSCWTLPAAADNTVAVLDVEAAPEHRGLARVLTDGVRQAVTDRNDVRLFERLSRLPSVYRTNGCEIDELLCVQRAQRLSPGAHVITGTVEHDERDENAVRFTMYAYRPGVDQPSEVASERLTTVIGYEPALVARVTTHMVQRVIGSLRAAPPVVALEAQAEEDYDHLAVGLLAGGGVALLGAGISVMRMAANKEDPSLSRYRTAAGPGADVCALAGEGHNLLGTNLGDTTRVNRICAEEGVLEPLSIVLASLGLIAGAWGTVRLMEGLSEETGSLHVLPNITAEGASVDARVRF